MSNEEMKVLLETLASVIESTKPIKDKIRCIDQLVQIARNKLVQS